MASGVPHCLPCAHPPPLLSIHIPTSVRRVLPHAVAAAAGVELLLPRQHQAAGGLGASWCKQWRLVWRGWGALPCSFFACSGKEKIL